MIRATAVEVTMAAPAPWPTRATIRIGAFGAAAVTIEMAVNTAKPTRNTSRRPRRSASRPATRSRAAAAMALPDDTHAKVERGVSANSCSMNGKATLAAVRSRMMMKVDADTSASDSHDCRLTRSLATRTPTRSVDGLVAEDPTTVLGGSEHRTDAHADTHVGRVDTFE